MLNQRTGAEGPGPGRGEARPGRGPGKGKGAGQGGDQGQARVQADLCGRKDGGLRGPQLVSQASEEGSMPPPIVCPPCRASHSSVPDSSGDRGESGATPRACPHPESSSPLMTGRTRGPGAAPASSFSPTWLWLGRRPRAATPSANTACLAAPHGPSPTGPSPGPTARRPKAAGPAAPRCTSGRSRSGLGTEHSLHTKEERHNQPPVGAQEGVTGWQGGQRLGIKWQTLWGNPGPSKEPVAGARPGPSLGRLSLRLYLIL